MAAVRYSGLTPARRAALKKAQAASAAKRRGKGKGKLAAANRSNSRLKRGIKTAGAAVALGAVAYGSYKGAQYASKRGGMKHTQHGGGGATNLRTPSAPKYKVHPTDHFGTSRPKTGHNLGKNPSSNQIRKSAAFFGHSMTKVAAAKAKAAAAAAGTSGSHQRRIVGHGPALKPVGRKAAAQAKLRKARRGTKGRRKIAL